MHYDSEGVKSGDVLNIQYNNAMGFTIRYYCYIFSEIVSI